MKVRVPFLAAIAAASVSPLFLSGCEALVPEIDLTCFVAGSSDYPSDWQSNEFSLENAKRDVLDSCVGIVTTLVDACIAVPGLTRDFVDTDASDIGVFCGQQVKEGAIPRDLENDLPLVGGQDQFAFRVQYDCNSASIPRPGCTRRSQGLTKGQAPVEGSAEWLNRLIRPQATKLKSLQLSHGAEIFTE